jgi:hypothetical protein
VRAMIIPATTKATIAIWVYSQKRGTAAEG